MSKGFCLVLYDSRDQIKTILIYKKLQTQTENCKIARLDIDFSYAIQRKNIHFKILKCKRKM